jgi:invasion protein IalB
MLKPMFVVAALLAPPLAMIPVAVSHAVEYRLRPTGVVLPDGVPLGRYQRTTRPFENWTLICDENLDQAKMVCNFTQTVEDTEGNLAFSWSLAATSEGAPYMILRTASVADPQTSISFTFASREAPVEIAIDGCNEEVCVAMLPVGPIMRGEISSGGTPSVRYATVGGEPIEIAPTLAGLAHAIAALQKQNSAKP